MPMKPRAALLLTILLLTPTLASAVDCIDYGDYIHRETYVELNAEARDVVVLGGHVYVVDELGLRIFDVADPTRPLLVGQLGMPGASCLALQGDHAYVGNEEFDFHVVNVSDPTAPWVCGSLPIPTPAHDVELQGDRAYIAVGEAGLEILDIADPTAPDYVTIVDTPDEARDVEVRGDYAYVADWQGLVVIDITDLPRSKAVSPGRPGPSVISVALYGDHAYLLDTTFGLIIYDISDPLDPQWVDFHSSGGDGRMEVAGDRLYVCNSPGLTIYDLAEPAEPREICAVNNGGPASGLAVHGDFVYQTIREPACLDVIDATNPARPPERGRITLSGWPYHVSMVHPYAYLSSRSYGLRVVDVTDPGAMIDLGYVPGVESARQTIVENGLAYVAGEYDGLYLLGLAKPGQPEIIGHQPMGSSAVHMAKQGDLIYVSNWEGMRVVDVSDPTDPSVPDFINTEWSCHHVAARGHLVLLATALELILIDASDPADLQVVEIFDIKAKSLAFHGDRLYVSEIDRLVIYDANSLPALDLQAELFMNNYVINYEFVGSLAYLANGAGGMQVVDLATPTAPLLLGSIDHWAMSAFPDEDRLYVTDTSRLYVMPLHCTLTAVEETAPAAGGAVARLHPNQPNPFNPSTTIRYTLTQPARVGVTIHDVSGRLVRTLHEEGHRTAGLHEITWKGVDDRGRSASSGLYLCRLAVDGQVLGRSMILLK